MNPPREPPPPARPPGSSWRRLLAALGIGVLATFAGSGVGAVTLGLFGAVHEGAHTLRIIPAFVLYGMFFGPVLAWPVTLGVLPAIWLTCPPRFRRAALLVAGPLTGALAVYARLAAETDLGAVSWAMVSAATAGGLAAGVVFAVFARPHRGPPPRLP